MSYAIEIQTLYRPAADPSAKGSLEGKNDET